MKRVDSGRWTDFQKKKKSILSSNKVVANVFWDAKGIICIDYLEKGKNTTGEYY